MKWNYRIVLAIRLGVFVTILLLSAFTVYIQVRIFPLDYFTSGHQFRRHYSVLNGTARDPWQYRILSEYLVEATIIIFRKLGFQQSIIVGFVFFRYVENVLLFSLAYIYYKFLNLSRVQILIGLSLLAWGMNYSYYDSDLALNTFLDVIFYLIAAILIIKRLYWKIIPLAILAALNRETGVLIPVMLLIASVEFKQKKIDKIPFIVSITTLGTFLIVYFGVRFVLGPRDLLIPYGIHPGGEMLAYNISRMVTWSNLFATLGILPALALISMRRWPDLLRRFFWAIIPIWLVIHFFASVVAETRLFLVPHTLIFVPGALFGAVVTDQGVSPPADRDCVIDVC